MFRFENVLVAVSPVETVAPLHEISSIRLTPVHIAAIDLALVTGAQLTFCAVVAPQPTDAPSNAFTVPIAVQSDEGIRRELISLQEQAAAKGISARCLIRSGDFSEELIAESFEDSYDLVMFTGTSAGAHDKNSRAPVVDNLLLRSRCSAWAFHPKRQGDPLNIGFIGQTSENLALPLAVTLARLLNARLHVLHPINRFELTSDDGISIADSDPVEELASLRRTAESELKSQLERTDFRALPFGSKLEILDDDSETRIARYATENQLDLLIVSRRRLVRDCDPKRSLREEWSDLARNHSLLAVVPNPATA
ncbi:universal stress protein [Schlesneria paludicola]|uniref:universal stress protein n=1 Tax=Schlesneria paludicola TaxID=360056 RepID=UPI00029B2938|nr:universal stress protein [Schlesneria paludicola]